MPPSPHRAAASAAAGVLLAVSSWTAAPGVRADGAERGMDPAVTSGGATTTAVSSTLAYTCVAKEDGTARPYNAELSVTAPAEMRPGEQAEVRLSRFTGFLDRWTDEVIAPGRAGISARISLGGSAAVADDTTLTGVNTEEGPVRAAPDPGSAPVEFGAVTGSVTAGGEGEITFTPGAVTITVTQDRGELVTVCSPRRESGPIAATRVVERPAAEADAPDGGAEDPVSAVTAPGRVEWRGVYRCISSDPALQPDFESAASVAVTTRGEGFAAGDRIDAVGGFTLEQGLEAPMRLGPGGVTAELSVSLSGPAAPARPLILTTENAESLAAGQDILLPTATGRFTPPKEGEVRMAVSGLKLTIMAGVVTVDCRIADDGPAPSDPPAESSPEPSPEPAGPSTAPSGAPPAARLGEPDPGAPLPTTGRTLTGLLATAAAALLTGGALLLSARRGRPPHPDGPGYR